MPSREACSNPVTKAISNIPGWQILDLGRISKIGCFLIDMVRWFYFDPRNSYTIQAAVSTPAHRRAPHTFANPAVAIAAARHGINERQALTLQGGMLASCNSFLSLW